MTEKQWQLYWKAVVQWSGYQPINLPHATFTDANDLIAESHLYHSLQSDWVYQLKWKGGTLRLYGYTGTQGNGHLFAETGFEAILEFEELTGVKVWNDLDLELLLD